MRREKSLFPLTVTFILNLRSQQSWFFCLLEVVRALFLLFIQLNGRLKWQPWLQNSTQRIYLHSEEKLTENSLLSVSHILLILKINDSRKKTSELIMAYVVYFVINFIYQTKHLAPTFHSFICCFRIMPILHPAGLNALISSHFPSIFSETVLIQIIHFLSLLQKVESYFLINHVFCSIPVSLAIVLAWS